LGYYNPDDSPLLFLAVRDLGAKWLIDRFGRCDYEFAAIENIPVKRWVLENFILLSHLLHSLDTSWGHTGDWADRYWSKTVEVFLENTKSGEPQNSSRLRHVLQAAEFITSPGARRLT